MPSQKSLTALRCGKSTTCVETSGKRRVEPVSKWEKPVCFPISCPPLPRLTRLPTHLFPPPPDSARHPAGRIFDPLLLLRSFAANLRSFCSLVFKVVPSFAHPWLTLLVVSVPVFFISWLPYLHFHYPCLHFTILLTGKCIIWYD